MKRFWLAGVLGMLLFALQISAIAAETKVPIVTRNNFVSLEFLNRDEIGEYQTQFVVTESELRIEEVKLLIPIGAFAGKESPEITDSFKIEHYDKQPIYELRPLDTTSLLSSSSQPKSKSAGLSKNQTEALVNELNKARFRKATLSEIEKRQVQGTSSGIWLVVSDEMNRDQIYISELVDDYYLSDYAVLENYLYSLEKQKFPDGTRLWLNQYVPFTHWAFESLTLETSGGIAGIRSILKVYTPPESNHLHWSRSVGGKEFSQDESLGPRGTWSFFRSLNNANLPILNGKSYKQRNLADGFNEVLTLTLKDGRKFTFSNYGDQAPKAYSMFREYLNGLAIRKATQAQ